MQFPILASKYNKLILLLIAFIIFIFAFRNILTSIISQWSGAESAGHSHGFLVFLCTIYLLYIKRDQFRNSAPDPQKIGFILLAILCIVFFLAESTEIQLLQMLILPLLILSAIFTILGKQYLKLALVPVGIILFALPIWKPVLPLLQDITTWITEFNLNMLGRPAYVVGNYVHVTGGVFLIEEACSGLRFLLISIILSLINSDLNSHNKRQGAVLLLIAMGLAFLANWIRVIIIVVIGDLTNMQNSLVHDHVNFGWVVFLFIVLIPYLLISRLIPQNNFEAEKVSFTGAKATYAPRYFFLTLLLLLSVPFLRYGHQLVLKHSLEEIAVPSSLANWHGNSNVPGRGAWKPDYKNATKEIFKSYSGSSGIEIELYIFHYSAQTQGTELINVKNNIVDGTSWSVIPATERQHSIPDKNVKKVNALEIMNKSNEKKLIWYWYDVGGFITSNQYYAKLFQMLAQLQGKNYANLMAISIVCDNNCMQREHYLEDYVLDWEAVD